jgi:hypothetical protein
LEFFPYSGNTFSASSGRPMAQRKANVWRLTTRLRGQVTTGTPIHNASQLVNPPVKGKESSAIMNSTVLKGFKSDLTDGSHYDQRMSLFFRNSS